MVKHTGFQLIIVERNGQFQRAFYNQYTFLTTIKSNDRKPECWEIDWLTTYPVACNYHNATLRKKQSNDNEILLDY